MTNTDTDQRGGPYKLKEEVNPCEDHYHLNEEDFIYLTIIYTTLCNFYFSNLVP